MSKHDQKALILNEARSLFLETGEKGLSMRKLATSIGVTPAAIYWHFKNKEELLGEIFLEGVETFSRYMSKSLMGDNPLHRLQLCSEAFLAFGMEQPSHYGIFFLSHKPQVSEDILRQLSQLRRGTFQILLDRVRECHNVGLFRQDINIERTAMMLLSSCQGMMTMYRHGQLGGSEENFVQIYRNTYQLAETLLLAR
ncbi:TetR/AcrR family transcriptional regulator [Pseudomonas sp. 3JA]|uniref:TetR/AcrR family transcriptional regulator n=1 Tax=Pseudomonas sp. 3JA TaxID=3109347 RepID=UPI00300BBF3C